MAVSAKLPDLPYDFGALEPFISGKVIPSGFCLVYFSHSYANNNNIDRPNRCAWQIMEIHVTKHHQAYVTNLNAALVQYAEVRLSQTTYHRV